MPWTAPVRTPDFRDLFGITFGHDTRAGFALTSYGQTQTREYSFVGRLALADGHTQGRISLRC
jgi:hypothetical protein